MNTSVPEHEKTRFIVIDGHALIYRAYHAFPGLNDPQGRLVNAVYGFARILLTALRDFDPKYIAVAFDHKGPTKRAQEFEQYKAQRAPMPDDLIPQIQIVKDVVQALNIPQFVLEGYEADDLMGTLAVQVQEMQTDNQLEDHFVLTIVTGDRDILQLVRDPLVSVWMPPRGKNQPSQEFHEADVLKKMGVSPAQVPDLKGLMGDASDNIPGVPGVGEKTAQKLIQAFGSCEALYQTIESGEPHEVLKGAVLKKLVEGKELAFVSKQLATIDTSAPIKLDLPACRVAEFDKQTVIKLFESLDFYSLIPLLPQDAFESSVQDALF